MYDWYAVNTGKLCPTGWHVPSDEEFKQLEMSLGMSRASADASYADFDVYGMRLSWHKPGNPDEIN